MPKVVLIDESNQKQEIEVPAGSNLRKEARKAGVQLYKGLEKIANCRGLGLCGTCRVLVKEGMENLNKPGFMERCNLTLHPMTVLARIDHEDELRLACQVVVNGDCTVQVTPPFNWSGENFWQKPYPNK